MNINSHFSLLTSHFSIIMLDSDSKKWLASILGNAVRFDEPMSRHTSFRVGGPAEVFAAPENLETLISLVKGCEERELVYTVIGGGSNLLVKDSGIPGIVIGVRGNRAEAFTPHPSPLTAIVKAQAGASLSAFCMKAVKNGFAGMNFALGIPGTVGGGIMMNAGTALGSMENVLESVTVLGPGGKIAEIQRKEMIFAYRKFGVKAGFKPALLIEGSFRLCPGDPEKLKKEADEILETRRKQQPVEFPSAGCFFKNPECGQAAGKLIEAAGLKGTRIGGAEISHKHANFIINRDRASSADILLLMELIQETVSKRFNVELETEVKIIG